MGRKYNNGQPIAVGYDLQSNRPLDERNIVETKTDLLVLENCYAGIMVMVEDEAYALYQWNGINQSDMNNWSIFQGGSGSGVPEAPIDGKQYGRQDATWTEIISGGPGGGDMTKAVYDTNDDGKVDAADDSDTLGGVPPSGYMTKAQYDSNNNGKADDSDNLGGFPPSHYLTSTDLDGKMDKSVYDTNGNNIVDNSEQLGGQNPSFYDQSADVTSLQTQLDTHEADDNRHLSTDERAGMDNTPNPVSDINPWATQADIAAAGGGDMLKATYDQNDNGVVDNAENLGGSPPAQYDQSAHAADITTNPHAVTKAQVGLGNVDNTSDLNKPISTATQAALDLKADATDLNNVAYTDQQNAFVTQQRVNGEMNLGTPGGSAGQLNIYNATGSDESNIRNIAGQTTLQAQNGYQFRGDVGQSLLDITTEVATSLDPTTDNGIGNRAYNDARYAVGTIPTDYVSNDTTGEPTGADAVLKMVSCTQAEYDAGPKNAATFYVITDTVFVVGGETAGTQSIGNAKYEGVEALPTIDNWAKFRSLGLDEMERLYLDNVPLEAGERYRITLRYRTAVGSTAIMKLAGYINEELDSQGAVTIRREFIATETDMKEFSFYLTTVPAQSGQELWIKELTLERFI